VNKTFGQADPRLEAYIYETYQPEDAFLANIRVRQKAAGMPEIQVAPLDARHLEVIARAIGARRVVEVGTLGGYSAACLLRGMAEGGVLHTFELSEKHAEVARETFELGGFANAHVHVGPALEGMHGIEREGPFDLVFIDADKLSYPRYLAWAEDNLRVGGTVLLDNSFLFGWVASEPHGEREAEIRAMREVHHRLADPEGHFRSTLLPTGEGLAMGVKIR
jgi:caffeoyl-CoA O-methyltransferase